MRIGSGDLRGRRLRAPRGERTRPTSGRLKKSLFDVIAPRLPGSAVLDLYAGSGALALEALSRGASRAVLVEKNRRACEAIRANVQELGLADRVEILAREVSSAIGKLILRGDRFEVVFADPPYRADPDKLLGLLAEEELVARGGLAVLEHHHKRELRESYGALARARTLKAGESCLTLYEWVG